MSVPGIAIALLCLLVAGAGAADRVTIRSLPSPAPAGSAEPRLVDGPDGSVAMSWLERRAARGHRLRWALWNGRQWSRPATIAEGDSFFANWADFPSLRWLGGERWAAHWLWKSGPGTYAYDVRISQSADGGRTWARPVTPHRDGTATEHGFVSLLRDGNDLRAVWLDGRNFAGHDAHDGPGADMTVRTALVDAAGRLRGEQRLDARACDCCATAAVRTRRGALVAYRDRDAGEIRDISLVRLEAGRWTRPYPLHADGWTIAGCPVNGPAMDAAGDRVAVAWFTAAADSPRVHIAFSSDAGRRFTPPIRVDQGAPLGRVDVACMDDGTALVSWLETAGNDVRILMRRVSPAGRRDAPVRVTGTAASRSSGFPQMIRGPGGVVFAWTDAGSPARIRLARVTMPAGASGR